MGHSWPSMGFNSLWEIASLHSSSGINTLSTNFDGPVWTPPCTLKFNSFWVPKLKPQFWGIDW